MWVLQSCSSFGQFQELLLIDKMYAVINTDIQSHFQPFSLTMGYYELKTGAFMCDPIAQKGTSITYRDSKAISRQCRATFT